MIKLDLRRHIDPVPVLEMARHQAKGLEFLQQAQPGEHFQRGRMGRGRTRSVIYARLSLDQCDLEAFLNKGDRRDNAYGARADDADVGFFYGLHYCDGLFSSAPIRQPR